MAVTTVAALGTGAASGMALGGNLKLPMETAVLWGYYAGLVGFWFGAIAEGVAEKVLSKKGIGITRGSKIVQGAGVAGYGVTLAIGLALMAAIAGPRTPSAEPNTDSYKTPPATLSAPKVS